MQTEDEKRPADDGSGLAAFLLAVLVVVATPAVLIPALVVKGLLGWRWPDRLVAAVLAVFGAVGVALLLLSTNYVGAWLSAGRWLVWEVNPWARVPVEQPDPASWLLLAGVGLMAGTVYGALRWATAQARREADLYDGLDAKEERLAAEERRRRIVAHATQRFAVPLGGAKGPFLGVYQRGNLGGEARYSPHRRREDRPWRRRQLVRLPLGVPGAVQHVALLGSTGQGKSETAARLVAWALSRGWQVVYLSSKEAPSPGKAEAPRLAQMAEALGRTSRVLSADYPYDPFRGDDDAIRDRLVSVEEWRQDYWKHSANFLIGLALNLARARGESVSSFPELVHSLTPTYLKTLPAGADPNLPHLLNALGNAEFSGAVVRYGSMALNLKGWIDSAPRGWSFEDADLIAAELPMATRPEAGRGLLRMMVRDFGSYIADPERRKLNPDGSDRPILLVLEEVGAVSTDAVLGREFTTLVERARSANVFSVFTAQGPSGLGEPEVIEAIFTNTTVVSYRQTVGAELVAQLVGTQRVNEASKSYDQGGLGVGGSSRRQDAHQISPNYLRGLTRGEAVIISGRRFCAFAAVKGAAVKPSSVPAAVPASPYTAVETPKVVIPPPPRPSLEPPKGD